MLRHDRRLDSEHYFHVIHRSTRHAPLFLRPKDYRDFLQILRTGLARYPIPVLAYCGPGPAE